MKKSLFIVVVLILLGLALLLKPATLHSTVSGETVSHKHTWCYNSYYGNQDLLNVQTTTPKTANSTVLQRVFCKVYEGVEKDPQTQHRAETQNELQSLCEGVCEKREVKETPLSKLRKQEITNTPLGLHKAFASELVVQDVSPRTSQSRESYLSIVQEKAQEYNVSASLMTAIIDCENRSWKADLQSGHTYKKDRPKQGLVAGQQEQSFGLVQIHLPDHPAISYEQATNPTFSIEFLASELSAGRGKQWTCYSVALNKINQAHP